MPKMTLLPHVSEKSYYLSEERNTYVFVVPNSANKQTVKDEVERQFKVEVVNVNIVNMKGKPKVAFSRPNQSGFGKRKDKKKAYVTLADGDEIELFEEAA